MEQKKTLLIALSAGVFLLVVFGTAALKYSGGAKNNVSAIALKDSNDILFATDTIEKKPAAGSAGLVIEPVSESGDAVAFDSGTYTPSSGSASVTTIDMLKNQGGTADSGTLVASASPASSPVSAQNAAAEKVVKETQNVKKIEEKPKSSANTGNSSTAKASASASANTGTTVKKSSTPLSSPTAHYWVQVASFASKNNAEDARAELERNNLPCEVFTSTINGQLFYRVRVGGYATKSDAENVRKQINTIPMFKASNCFVTDVAAKK